MTSINLLAGFIFEYNLLLTFAVFNTFRFVQIFDTTSQGLLLQRVLLWVISVNGAVEERTNK